MEGIDEKMSHFAEIARTCAVSPGSFLPPPFSNQPRFRSREGRFKSCWKKNADTSKIKIKKNANKRNRNASSYKYDATALARNRPVGDDRRVVQVRLRASVNSFIVILAHRTPTTAGTIRLISGLRSRYFVIFLLHPL